MKVKLIEVCGDDVKLQMFDEDGAKHPPKWFNAKHINYLQDEAGNRWGMNVLSKRPDFWMEEYELVS